jgi:mono/diheme cytochrome c family protein
LNVLAWFLVPLLSAAPPAAPPAAQQTPPSSSLSATEHAGEKLFLQRCSLCHLGSAPTYRPYGPPLDGVVTSKGEDRVRKVILEGSSPGMPGWRYSLEPAQVDLIIAYIKMLRKP